MSNKKYEYLGNLSPGCKGITYTYAKELRQNKTEAEEKLWSYLRNRKLKGKKFRRQHPIANYILDFIVMSVSWRLNWMAITTIKKKSKNTTTQERRF